MIYALFIAWCLTVCGAGLGLVAYRWLQDRRTERLERILAARKAERVATLQHIADVDPAAIRGTFDALVADVTASDYGDQDHWSDYFAGRSETPTFDRLCADVARREAAELDGEWEREAGA